MTSGAKRSIGYLLMQAGGMVVLLGFLWQISTNLHDNMQALGVQFDMSFLGMESGFGVTQKWVSHQSTDSNANVLLVGVINLVTVSLCGMVCSTCLGILLALMMHSENMVLNQLGRLAVVILRNVPVLIQILFWYNVWIMKMPSVKHTVLLGGVAMNNRGIYFPVISNLQRYIVGGSLLWLLQCCIGKSQQVVTVGQRSVKRYGMWWVLWASVVSTGCLLAIIAYANGQVTWPRPSRFNVVGFHVSPEFIGLLCGLSGYTAGYNAESIRGAIRSVSVKQKEAADSLNLGGWVSFTRVILPQAMPALLPALSGHYLNLSKNASLGLAIGYPELFTIFAGTVLNQTGRAMEVIGIVMGIYLALSIFMVSVVNAINRRQAHWKGVNQG